jgi:hypothetical protein
MFLEVNCCQYSKTKEMHFLYSIFFKLTACNVSTTTCSSSGGATQTAVSIFNACTVHLGIKGDNFSQLNVHFLVIESFLLFTRHVSGQLNPSSGVHCTF